jgi:CRP/FNR family transcriptional regulator, cyclic AMP receptor protein
MTRVNAAGPADEAMRQWPRGTLLDALDLDDRRALIACGTQRLFGSGENLIMEGDAAREVFLLLDGWAKVVGNTADGRAVLLSIRTTGDVVGELAALDGKPRSASVIVATRVTARVITQSQFLAFLGASPAAALAVSRSIAAKMRLVTRHRIDVSGAPVLQRVTRVLEYLVESYATPCAEGLRIDVPLSRPELAALVGVAEPSLYRALAYLHSRHVLVTRHRREIICDLAALKKISREADPDAKQIDANSGR